MRTGKKIMPGPTGPGPARPEVQMVPYSKLCNGIARVLVEGHMDTRNFIYFRDTVKFLK